MDRFENLREKILPVLHPYVNRIAVFGSFARGENTSQSDIDILVKLRPRGERPSAGLKWFGLEEELGHILKQKVDLVTENALSPYVRPNVEKDMVVLYEEG